MEKTEHGYTLTIPLLRQRDVEAFARAYHDTVDGGGVVRNGAIAQTAARLGWIVKTAKSDPDDGVPIGNLDADAVDELFPFVVSWIAGEVSSAYVASFEVPGE